MSNLANLYAYGGPTRSPISKAAQTYAYGGPTRSPVPRLVTTYSQGGPTRPATTQGTGSIGNFLSNLGGVFQQVTRSANNVVAAATGTNTDNAPDDGARDWLSRLPQIGNAVMDMIGAGVPEETVTVTQAGYGSERGGLDLGTIAMIGAIGFGVYYIATR